MEQIQIANNKREKLPLEGGLAVDIESGAPDSEHSNPTRFSSCP